MRLCIEPPDLRNMMRITTMQHTKRFLRLLRAWRLLAVLVALVGSGTLVANPEPSAAQTATPQAQSVQHNVYLPLVTMSGGAPTSDELIAAALKRGEIDQQTALL